MEGDFRIDRWLVQPQLNAIVSPDNSTVQLEPKVMEVLVYLAEHADEVLPKERILQAVWPDTFVTEDVLMHAISEIRKALGEDAKDPRYAQTIPKRGYRLIASVTPLRQAVLRYEVMEKLVEGGKAEVYLARDTELQCKVAPKFIRAGEAEDESAERPLFREARAAIDYTYARS